jgi:hypothetical protein
VLATLVGTTATGAVVSVDGAVGLTGSAALGVGERVASDGASWVDSCALGELTSLFPRRVRIQIPAIIAKATSAALPSIVRMNRAAREGLGAEMGARKGGP